MTNLHSHVNKKHKEKAFPEEAVGSMDKFVEKDIPVNIYSLFTLIFLYILF